jgi:dUTP pyrophosphatase
MFLIWGGFMGQTISNSFVWRRGGEADADGSGDGSKQDPRRLEVGVSHLLDVPTRKTAGAAGFDLSSTEQVTIPPRQRACVSTGVKLAMPSNVYAGDEQVVIYATLKGRSGLAKKGIDVHTGTIDCDYRGEIKAIVVNNTDQFFSVEAGDRVAQLVFGLAVVPDLGPCDDGAESAPTQRGEEGFGSTGVHAAAAAPSHTSVVVQAEVECVILPSEAGEEGGGPGGDAV